MQSPAAPPDEAARIKALRALRLLDTPPEERFDAITRLASSIFEMPIAMVTMVDVNRQWFKSRIGLEICETSRDISFCAHAILSDVALVIPDAHEDPRFADNPLVTGEPHLRFYAGQPLHGPDGSRVGTLCIADRVPRKFPPEKRRLLAQLGELIERELRSTDIIDLQTDLLATQGELLKAQERLHSDIAEAAKYVRSRLPQPVREPLGIDWRFLPSAILGGDCFGYHEMSGGRMALYLLDVCGHGIGAALLSVTLLRVLRTESLSQVDFTDPAAVLTALNREFPMAQHGNRYFTLWYGVMDLKTRRLAYASGGHPPAILVSADGRVEGLATNGIGIGLLAQWPYDSKECTLQQGQTLYIFSDGGYEIRDAAGVFMSVEQFGALLSRAALNPGESLDYVLDEVRLRTGLDGFPDDVSIMEVRIP